MEIQVNYYVIILSCIGFLLTCLFLCLIHVLLHHEVQTSRVNIASKGLHTRCKVSCTVAMDTTPNDVWNILQHVSCKILCARLCLHVARHQSNKMPSYTVEIICYTCGLNRKYRVLVSVCLSVCLCVSTITQKIKDLGS